ncbi:uncharacterized protein BKA55DRAFT_562044 [Fusarium redolens]|uniref:Uncharacterized protein n=1 Tax=Fusarium redolens TaxID=48865 RepID=A0A9P9KJ58_FUSRE|nr:uncharacterized protein BKA55DRAFT_562044 [Fusarium redolens]KAH7259095.1 hypothetical protein BKA55DRAFT_562044 [Fusarium redolens]
MSATLSCLPRVSLVDAKGLRLEIPKRSSSNPEVIRRLSVASYRAWNCRARDRRWKRSLRPRSDISWWSGP